jgi:SAM-dependent methyltransferase
VPEDKVERETDPRTLLLAMVRKLPAHLAASGQLVLPALPSFLDLYTESLTAIFASLGRVFSPSEVEHLRSVLKKELDAAYAESPFSKVVVDYRTELPASTAMRYMMARRIVSLDEEYAEWVRSRKPPLFGAHADAKVLALARTLGEPASVAVLDVGAGDGRNTIPLAQLGFATDAVELAPTLAAVLRKELQKTRVNARVFEGDALDPKLGIPSRHYRLIVLAEVVASHFKSVAQLRTLFERAADWLAPGGLLLFSAFVAVDGYEPDSLQRELAEVALCCIFTKKEIDTASEGLPFAKVSDESTHDYEHEHLDKSAWPPTGWFVEWSRGRDLFDVAPEKSPLELRWLVYRREP